MSRRRPESSEGRDQRPETGERRPERPEGVYDLWEALPEERAVTGRMPVTLWAESAPAEATRSGMDSMDQMDGTKRVPIPFWQKPALAVDDTQRSPVSFPSFLSLSSLAALPTGCHPSHDRLAALRRLLAEKYPAAERRSGGILPTGLAPVDAVEGGLRRAALTELSGSSGAGALFLQAMLRAVNREKCLAALVDAARSFDPEGCAPSALTRLLLVLCADAAQAVKAADLLLRDGNLSLVLLDLQAAPRQQIRRIHASTWHRLQRLVEQTASALTPQPMVEGARVRIALHGSWTLAAQRRWRHELVSEMPARVYPRHSGDSDAPRQLWCRHPACLPQAGSLHHTPELEARKESVSA